MPRMKMRVISPGAVNVRRNGDAAIINYSDPAMGAGMNLKVGPGLANMTDLQVVELHNDMIKRMGDHREAHPYVAVEIPEGKPQIEHSNAACGPRGATSCGAPSNAVRIRRQLP